MTRAALPRQAAQVIVLVATWCALWRDLSPANLLSGVAVAVVVVASGIGTSSPGRIRIVPLLRLCRLVLTDLVRSTVAVGVEILTPTDRTAEEIIAVRIPDAGRHHLLLLTVAITVTPGTAVVDADPDTGTLYLHILHHDRRAGTVAFVDDLVRLTSETFPRPRTEGALR